jgi:predicted MFS family arabinose efflux permease
MSLPVFFPIMAIQQGVSGLTIGLVIALPALVAIFTTPLVNHYINRFGIEESILYSMIVFGLSNCIMAATYFC